MKLKKIASLMLAGIMAVSMLAGCKSGSADNGNAGSSSSQPTTTGVVAAVDAGIKSWNQGLTVSVESSKNMDAAIADLFKKSENKKVSDAEIVKVLNDVFGSNMKNNVNGALLTSTNFTSAPAINDANRYRFVIIPVTKANGDVNTYAGNIIGAGISGLGLKNVVDDDTGAKKVDVDYTLYVTAEQATMADNSVGTYVIGVMVAEYSEHIA